MQWSNVKWIFLREIRDQLRDRRTMFAIFVLPVLMYPLMGMVILQITQFVQEHPTKVRLVGWDQLPDEPALLEESATGERHFSSSYSSQADRQLLTMTFEPLPPDQPDVDTFKAQAQQQIRDDEFDLVVRFPAGFSSKLKEFNDRVRASRSGEIGEDLPEIPAAEVYVDSTDEKSGIARGRVLEVLDKWHEDVVEQVFSAGNMPLAASRPFEIERVDVAREESRRVAVLAQLVPYLILIWSLVGAFYPAVDLCAGEKERGTMETLLSSPAGRGEIVAGKLFTIMSFSTATSLLNLVSLGVTGLFVASVLPQANASFTAPPLITLFWMLVVLIPISLFFSGLTLAVASFARSTKEGQYYLAPLMLVSLPLLTMTMIPSVELTLGTSLIPLTGAMLLLEALLESDYALALQYALPVLLVTGCCCYLSIRWAIYQFNNESVLFRDSEQWSLKLWLKKIIRQRGDNPPLGAAISCAVLILVLRFFANFVVKPDETTESFMLVNIISQLLTIALPALLFACLLSRRPASVLRLTSSRPAVLACVAAMAICLHPVMAQIGIWIQQLYPISQSMAEGVESMFAGLNEVHFLWLLLFIAVTPAICEELAFRGLIQNTLEKHLRPVSAIMIASFFFGVTHGILQQSLTTFFVGILIGVVAWRSRSLWPCMLYHFVHNGITAGTTRLDDSTRDKLIELRVLEVHPTAGLLYTLPAMLVGLLLGTLLIWVFFKVTQTRSSTPLAEAASYE
jgi:sodium transport system permease protein